MGVFCNGLQTLLRKKGKRKAKEKKKELSIKRLLPTLHGKPYFLSPDVLKDGLSKKTVLEYDLTCIIGKDNISFSRKYDLTN